MELTNKVMTLKEAVKKYVSDGDCLTIGGFTTNRRPYAITREIIRQGKKNLIIESGSAGGDVDMLIGAGLVQAINISYIANSGFTNVCRCFRRAIEQGTLPFEDYSLDVQNMIYHGAALGLPYVPLKNMLGSDLEKKWGISEEERKSFPKLSAKKFIIAEDPFHKGSRLCLVPTPKIDVALIHVQAASPDGTGQIEGPMFSDVDIAMAAKHTLVSCEKLVSNEEIRKSPDKNLISGICVDAVVEAPFGAHPSQCYNVYDYDANAYREYDRASHDQESFNEYIKKYVQISHEKYLGEIGEKHLKKLKIDPEVGYVISAGTRQGEK